MTTLRGVRRFFHQRGRCGRVTFMVLAALWVAASADAQTGAINGTVTDHNGGAAIEGVSVQVYDASGNFVTTATSDVSGVYTTDATLDDGDFFARTSNSLGFLNELYDGTLCQWSCDVTTGTPIVVSGGLPTGGIDFALVLGGSITGTVTVEGTGAPIENVEVIVYDSTGFIILYRIATDDTGSYATGQNLTAGTYYARTWNELGYLNEQYDGLPCVPTCAATGGTPITVTSGPTETIDFALVRGGSVSGTVVDLDTSDPIANMAVDIRDDSGSWMGVGTTDADGNYMTPGIPPGTYFAVVPNRTNYLEKLYDDLPCHFGCNATSGTPITVTDGVDTPGIDFALENGGTISGVVTETGGGPPIAGAWVRIHNAAGSSVMQQRTEADGSYTTTGGIPSGTYQAMTVNWDGYIDKLYDDQVCVGSLCNATLGMPITVTTGADTPGIDFALDPGATFSGIVTDSQSGHGLWSRHVKVYDGTGTFVCEGFTDADGLYRTRAGVPTGTYFARSSDYTTYIDEIFDDIPCYGSCDVTVGTPLAATAGSDFAGVNFALDSQGAIMGRVTDAVSGAGLDGVFVAIYDAAGTYITYDYTDVDGDYKSLHGLGPGDYFVRTTFASGDYLGELYDGYPCSFGCDPTDGTPVTVAIGANTGAIDFALARGGLISGRVTDAVSGDPLAGVAVKIHDASGVYRTENVTDAGGYYISPVYLPEGDYVAYTINGLGYIDELYSNMSCEPSCDPTNGTLISVAPGVTTMDIDFVLEEFGLFRDGFETGTTSAWSETVIEPPRMQIAVTSRFR